MVAVMSDTEDEAVVPFSIDWSARQGMAPTYWNQILIQPGVPVLDRQNDGAYLTFGHVAPPYVPDESAAAGMSDAERVLKVEPIVSLVCSRERMIELYYVISNYLNLTEPPSEPETEEQP
ncbi:hypothetical protein C5C18_10270 [Rathayibacter tritici]|nr:hypothetical protein C5C21_08000 [Rathayibacter tritici]PPG06415.1 hypothetical protein C5C18_10270 [Rathayibacter tritici]PPI45440.1 hypothetical protein C5D18_06405 [Rathayibacter tritici]